MRLTDRLGRAAPPPLPDHIEIPFTRGQLDLSGLNDVQLGILALRVAEETATRLEGGYDDAR